VSRSVGIDYGTTNSAIAVLDRDGSPRILTTPEGATTMPSLVALVAEAGRTRSVVGEAALEIATAQPAAVAFAAKRLIGRRFDDPEVQRWATTSPCEVIAAPNGDAWLKIGDQELSPQLCAAITLRQLATNAERFVQDRIDAAVITVPAWFDACQRQAIKDAAEMAGLQVRRLVSEPTAAALGHGAHRGVDRRYAVVDLGGGTFDVSICEVAGGLFEVLATAGDAMLGGDDIDRVVVDQLVGAVRTTTGVDVSGDLVATTRLRLEAQRVKHNLSTSPLSDIAVPRLARSKSGAPIDLVRHIRRDELELWSAPVIRRLEAPCHAALARAGVRREELDEVLLVGGATRMPAVRRRIAQVFGREPTVIPNPDEVVAIGAAIEVARLEGRIEGVLLVDVTARGLALGGPSSDRCDIVIPAGSVVPTREHRLIATTRDNQRELAFSIWEGEAEETAKNSPLARYQVSELPAAPAGEVLVLVEVTVDVDGTARVTATELVSGERPPMQVTGQAGLPRASLNAMAPLVQSWRAP
jgi:molecular chaperone DnaK